MIATAAINASGLSPSKPPRRSKLKSRPRLPTRVVGGSPFQESLASSTVTAQTSVDPSPSVRELTTSEEITASFLEDYADLGDGGDSDVEGEEGREHLEALLLSLEDAHVRDEANDLDWKDVGIPGAPMGWVPPGPPEDWAGYQQKYDGPEYWEVDNPGSWGPYAFAPKYVKQKYTGHYTPANAKVVPENENGDREMGGYKFHYNGWSPDAFDASTFVQGDATRADMRRKSRLGSLDVEVLKKHGLTLDRLRNEPLFFLQLLLPICNPKLSGIDGDDRIPYFTHVCACTNSYAVGQKDWGGGYGHRYENTDEAEMVNWTGVTIRHGARMGTPGSLHTRWCKDDPEFDQIIHDSITPSRWKQLKSVFKLNHNMMSPKKGMEGYDPASKYDHIFQAVVHNMNYCTKYADLDAALDESSWPFSGYCGDAGGRLKNKPMDKGTLNCSSYDY